MSFKELVNKDMAILFNSEEIATSIMMIPYMGVPYSLDVIFDESEQSVNLGMDTVSTNPVITLPICRLRHELSNKDIVVIDSKQYRVRDKEPDGTGIIDILL